MSCPTCGRDVWLYDANTWTCKEGHHFPFDDRARSLEDLAKRKRRVHPYALSAGAASLTVGVIHLLSLIF